MVLQTKKFKKKQTQNMENDTVNNIILQFDVNVFLVLL